MKGKSDIFNGDFLAAIAHRRCRLNKGLAIAGGQWLIEVLCFYFTFVLADSLVLRNARHRQAPNRWWQFY